MKVLVSNIMMLNDRGRFEAEILAQGLQPVFADVDQYLSEEECLSLVGDMDGWLAGDDQITHAVLTKALPKLKVISKWGTGVDSIDLEAASKLSIPVHRSPGAFSDAVAEVAIGYMLDLARHLSSTDRAVRAGLWPKPSGSGLVDRKLGLVGFGAIGRGIAERALAMKMSVIAYDPFLTDVSALNVEMCADTDRLFSEADYLCLCCNLTNENRHFINLDSVKKLKPGVVLINVARGPLIQNEALVSGLQSGHVSAAGLDVYEVEPIDENSPLLKMDNVVLGSHNANNLNSATEYVHANTLRNLFKELEVA